MIQFEIYSKTVFRTNLIKNGSFLTLLVSVAKYP